MRRARGGVFPAALLLLVWVFAPAAALEVGQRGTLRTVVRGDVPIDVPVVYLGLLENAAGPGYDIHLVELEGPVGEQVGVASGMSGSPVYFDGRPLGALAYRFGAIPRRPVGGVTPLATMRDAERSAATRPVAEDGALRAIATPVAAPGLLPVTRRFLAPRLEPLGLQLVAGAASGSSGDASSAVAEDARLVPGGPVGVQLVRGDLDVAATGTVTAIDGDRVLAFGHPFLGGGRTSLPMTTARVVHTLADMVGSFRMTRIGDEVGAIVEDRLAAIVGRTDRRAATIPVELTLDGRLDRAETYRFEVSRHPTLSPLMTATALLNALSADNGAELASTVRVTGELTMDGASPLPVRIVASGAGGADPNLGAALQLLGLLSAVWGNPYEEPAAVRLRLDARVVPEVVAYEVEDVQFDRRGLRPGDELELRVGVRRHRGPREVRTVRLRLPDSGPGPRRLQLAIGGPTEIERVIGTPLARRLESATDLASTVRVYADLPPAGRVQAVLLEPGGTIVSDGVAWDHLPASAARLLATERSAAESRRPAAPTVLASAHFDLDGPVTGSTRAVVRLDGSNGPSKESSP